MTVSILKDKGPIEFIIISFKKDYELSDGNETDEQTYPYYKVEVKLLSNTSDDDFKELTSSFIEDTIRKFLNIRMKLFSIHGECLVDILYL